MNTNRLHPEVHNTEAAKWVWIAFVAFYVIMYEANHIVADVILSTMSTILTLACGYAYFFDVVVTHDRSRKMLADFLDYQDEKDAALAARGVSKTAAKLHDYRHELVFVLVPALNKWLRENHGYELTVPENQLILYTVHKMSPDDFQGIYNFVKNHPYWTLGIGRLFVDMFHKKKLKGEVLSAAEILVFLNAIKKVK